MPKCKTLAFNHTITTVAGNGAIGFSGDGSLAIFAELSGPAGVAIDPAGNIYVADWDNQWIRKVNTSGIITTIAGNGTTMFCGDGGPATSACLRHPYGVAVDGSGNVYIDDSGNSRVRKVTASTGKISTVAGGGNAGIGDNGPATKASLAMPTGVAVFPLIASSLPNSLYIAVAGQVPSPARNVEVRFSTRAALPVGIS